MHSVIYDYIISWYYNYLKWSKSLILHLGHSTQWLTVAFNELKGMHTFQLVFSHRITNCPVVIILDAVWFHSLEAILD